MLGSHAWISPLCFPENRTRGIQSWKWGISRPRWDHRECSRDLFQDLDSYSQWLMSKAAVFSSMVVGTSALYCDWYLHIVIITPLKNDKQLWLIFCSCWVRLSSSNSFCDLKRKAIHCSSSISHALVSGAGSYRVYRCVARWTRLKGNSKIVDLNLDYLFGITISKVKCLTCYMEWTKSYSVLGTCISPHLPIGYTTPGLG